MHDKEMLKKMIQELMELNSVHSPIPRDEESMVMMLKDLMTLSRPGELSQEYYQGEEVFLETEKKNQTIISADDIDDELMPSIFLYQGDITLIKADAIVNAANEKLLGCFIPGHHCIDNAIHLAAGLQLRNECYRLMQLQGQDEKTGQAKVTPAYNLPSDYVIHTVGPNLHGPKELSDDDLEVELAACYQSVFEAIKPYKAIETVVFCSISTGVYGVPIALASRVALRSIRRYLAEHDHHIKKVIIDCFSEEDYHEYEKQARIINEGHC